MKKVLLTLLFLLSMLCTFAAQRKETIKLPSGQEVIVNLFDDDELSILGPVDKNISGVLDFTLQTDRLVWFDDEAFKGCSNITEVKINVKKIGVIKEYAFKECSSLKKVSIQAETGRINIQWGAFFECFSLEEVNFSIATISGKNSIGCVAFKNCNKLKAINLEAIDEIEAKAFFGCSSLVSINLQAIKKIGGEAFGECKNLTTVKLPSNCITVEVESTPFADCPKLSNETKKNMISWGKKHNLFSKKKTGFLSFMDSRGVYIMVILDDKKQCYFKINGSWHYGTWEKCSDFIWIDFDPNDCPTIAFNGSVAKRTRMYISTNLENIGVSSIAVQAENPKLTYRLATALFY